MVALLLMSGLAFATNDDANECGNHGNNCGTPTGGETDPASYNFNQGQDQFQGQEQFQGQVAVGVGVGVASADSNSTSSVGDVSNSNTNTNNVSNTANGGAGGNATASGGEGGSANASVGDVTVNVNGGGNGSKRPVSTAYSPGLTSGIDSCMGSVSLGAQGVGFGVSGGTTKIDQYCVLMKQTYMLWNMGLHDVACARMTLGEEGAAIREAMDKVGVTCEVFSVEAKEKATRDAEKHAIEESAHVQQQMEVDYLNDKVRELEEVVAQKTATPAPVSRTVVQNVPYLSEEKRAALKEVVGDE